MRGPFVAILLCGLPALAACGPNGREPQAVQAVPAQKRPRPGPDEVLRLEPGRWITRFGMVPLDASGRLEPVAEDGRGTIIDQGVTLCVAAAQAVRSPAFFAAQGERDCRVDKLIVQNGRLNAALVCDQPDGRRMALTLEGSFAPTAYDISADARVLGGAGPPKRLRMRAGGRRTGPCGTKGSS